MSQYNMHILYIIMHPIDSNHTHIHTQPIYDVPKAAAGAGACHMYAYVCVDARIFTRPCVCAGVMIEVEKKKKEKKSNRQEE